MKRFIKTHIRPGSTIYSDSWKGYSNLEKLGFIHRRVNYKKPSKSQTLKQIHTQHAEGLWRGTKMNILKRDTVKEKLDLHLKEFVFRRKNEADLWMGFINAIKKYKI